ncbi:MAG: beta-ketoacyl-ACP synthase II [Planctomycetaceae bacterium]|jgi:3-oxoacyl-[acyl-carrier-protein] synthase II|nr:beta-ketoacyl-ACP synthase II [Planctomycetaceae bacterium]
MKRVLVTGYGLVTPLGCNAETVWRRVCSGESGIRLATLPRTGQLRSKVAGECSDFTTDGYMLPHEAKRLELFAQYAVVAAIDAVKHSGLDFNQEDRERCAAIIGSGVGGLREFETQHTKWLDKGTAARISPFAIPRMMPNSAAGHVSIQFGLLGPAYSISTACASSVNAAADAVRLIRCGEMDIVLAGGSEAALCDLGLVGFSAMRALSERNDAPAQASRPFDKDRDGFVLSDGCGVLVLESEEHAKKRGAAVLGEIKGCALTSDGTHITQPDENGLGAGRAMQKALADAKINASDIDYINAHGTSTVLGDLAEVRAIKRAFGSAAYSVAVSSTKSQLGHQLGGSGAVEAVLCLLAIRDGIVPPTINLENPDTECDLDFTPLTAKERPIKTVLSNSFGFGGHNACMVLGCY